jgi:hypothetical protein
VFLTDFSYPEGSRDPLARFEAALAGTGPEDQEHFFHLNVFELLHGRTTIG